MRRTYIQGVVLALVVIGLLCLGVFYFQPGTRIAAGFTEEKLLSLRPGMSEKEIEGIAGSPLYYEDIRGVRRKGKQGSESETAVWVYAEKSPLLPGGLEIALIVSEGVLRKIYVENFDLGVYWWQMDSPPVMKDQRLLRRLLGR